MTASGVHTGTGGNEDACGAGTGWSSSPDATGAAEVIRDVGLHPLFSGFLQGFASVAIPIWRERRAARKAAREAASKPEPLPIPPQLQEASGEGGVWLGPQ